MMSRTFRVLIVEDEPSLLMSLEHNLRFEGYEVLTSSRGDDGLALAMSQRPDLVLLDIMLPGLDGFAFCKKLKETHPEIVVVILSARDQVVDVVRGLEWGADDYLKKPFDMAECLARIRVRLRNQQGVAPLERYSFGDVSLDFQTMQATRNGEPLSLTAREFRLMQLFVERRNEVVSREDILNQVWGYDVFPTTRTVDNSILRLRKLFEDDPAQPRWFLTIRGVGYRFLGD